MKASLTQKPNLYMNPLVVSALLATGLATATPAPAADERSGGNPAVITDAFLETVRTEARESHPSVAAARQMAAAAEAGIRAVRLWEDPMVGVGYMTGDEELMMLQGDWSVSAQVPLPRVKLYEAKKARARDERNIAESEAGEVAVGIETLAAQTAIELAMLDEMVRIERAELAWLENMAKNALERLKDPSSNASESLRIEAELARERQKIDSLQRLRERSSRQLAILLGKNEQTRWPQMALPETAPRAPGLPRDIKPALLRNPKVRTSLRASEAARHDADIARREAGPVVSVGADSGFFSGSGYKQTTVGVQVSLPWFNGSAYRASSERARKQWAASEKKTEGLLRDMEFEAVASATEAANAFHQARTLRDEVIPRARDAAESLEGAWISSRATVIESLEARKALLEVRAEERRLTAEGWGALEKLRAILPPASGDSAGASPQTSPQQKK